MSFLRFSPKRILSNKAFWGSVLLHLLLLVILLSTHKGINPNSASGKPPANQHKPLQAVLIVAQPKVATSRVSTPAQDTPAMPVAMDTPTESKAPVTPPIVAPNASQPPEPTPTNAAHNNSVDESVQVPKTHPDSQPAIASKPHVQATQRYLQQWQQQQQQADAQNASRHYQQQRRSPNLPVAQPQPYLTPEQQLWQAIQKPVDCSSALKQTLANISAITGGTVVCQQRPDLKTFLRNRQKDQGR